MSEGAFDIRELLDPAVYAHPVDRVELVETHLSWLVLAGERVYKLNRPLRLDFVDFSSFEARAASCQEALRLNRRLAPAWYLDVLPIGRDPAGQLRVPGPGPVLEYALEMRRFPDAALLDRALPAGRLRVEHFDRLAAELASFHAGVAVAEAGSDFGSPEAVAAPIDACLRSLAAGSAQIDTEQLRGLETWCAQVLAAQADVITQRQADGRVREGHGDLHLGNMFLYEDRIVVFDAIDFDPALRWIDVISDIAFCVMDLQARERPDLAWRFLDRYLQHSGDYAGLSLLRLYLVYRALVRAKVAGLRVEQLTEADDLPAREQSGAELRRYLDLAARCSRWSKPRLLITHGLSGSGKSFLSDRVPESIAAIRIRSDLERRRLPEGPPAQPYAAETRARVYHRLLELAARILDAGFSVLVDATFLERAWRQAFRDLAQGRGLAFDILAFHAPEALLRERIVSRAASGDDPSEADTRVLDQQLQVVEALDAEERQHAIVIDSSAAEAAQRVISAVQARPRS